MIGGDSSIRNVSVGLWCINEPNFCEACEASWSIGWTRVEDARRSQLWALWTSSADLAACLAACSYQFGLGKLEPIFGDVVEVALHSRWSEAIDERGQRLTHGKHWCGLRHHSLSIHEPKWRVMPQMAVADSLNHRTIAAVKFCRKHDDLSNGVTSGFVPGL